MPTYDAQSGFNNGGVGTWNLSTAVAHTMSAAANGAVFFLCGLRLAGVEPTVNSIVWNGNQNATRILRVANGAGVNCINVAEIWWLPAPATGARTWVATLSNTVFCCIDCLSWTDINQTLPFVGATANVNGTTTSPTPALALSTSAARKVLALFVSTGNNTANITGGTNRTAMRTGYFNRPGKMLVQGVNIGTSREDGAATVNSQWNHAQASSIAANLELQEPAVIIPPSLQHPELMALAG